MRFLLELLPYTFFFFYHIPYTFTIALIWCSVLLGNHLFTPLKATDLPHRWVYGDAPVPHLTSSDVFLTARNPNLNVHQDSSQSLESSTLAWKMPWTEEPGRLQSTKSLRIRHDWATSIWLFTFMHWRRKWQPIPVFFSRESQGQGSLVGCHLWGHIEPDTTEAT